MARYVRFTPRVTPDVMPVFTTERADASPTLRDVRSSAPVAVPPIVRPACCTRGCIDLDSPLCDPCWDSEIR